MVQSVSAALSFVLVQSVSGTCSKMRMLWISFLLIGSITCFPQQQQQQGTGGGQPWWWFASSSGQDPSKPSAENPAGQAGASVSYPGLYYSGTNTGSYGVQQQSSPQDSQHGAPGSTGPYQSTDESWTSSSDTSGEDEPVFTPVEDEDQVYAFKSRSRYNRKRLSFNQFRYTPTEPRFPMDPVFPQPQDPHKGKY